MTDSNETQDLIEISLTGIDLSNLANPNPSDAPITELPREEIIDDCPIVPLSQDTFKPLKTLKFDPDTLSDEDKEIRLNLLEKIQQYQEEFVQQLQKVEYKLPRNYRGFTNEQLEKTLKDMDKQACMAEGGSLFLHEFYTDFITKLEKFWDKYSPIGKIDGLGQAVGSSKRIAFICKRIEILRFGGITKYMSPEVQLFYETFKLAISLDAYNQQKEQQQAIGRSMQNIPVGQQLRDLERIL